METQTTQNDLNNQSPSNQFTISTPATNQNSKFSNYQEALKNSIFIR